MASFDVRRTVMYVVGLAVTAGAYVLCAKLGFSLAFGVKQVTAVWPPTGIAVAALVLGGYRLWPGVFAGAFIANVFVANASQQEPLYTAALIAAGNTLGPLAAAYFLRLCQFDRAFSRVRDVVVFVAFASIVAMAITATNGTAQLALAHIIPWRAYTPTWALWWAGDAMGVLLVAPLILTWSSARWGEIVQGDANPLEVTVLVALAIACSLAEFLGRFELAVPLYPFVVWVALRAGARITTALTVTACAIIVWGTVHHYGPFVGIALNLRLTALLLFAAVLSITGLVLCALTAERRSALAQMQAAERRFRVLAETVPQIVWTANALGTVDWVNQRWEEFSIDNELVGGIGDWGALIAAGQPFERELRLRTIDGVTRWFLLRAEPMRNERGKIVRWYGTHTDIDDQRRAVERSARIATTLQSAFLPESVPNHPRLRFDALYLTAESEVLIGGDWYDAFTRPDGRIVVSIGDVTGHGLTAAVSAARIRQSIVATSVDLTDPAAILAKVNRLLQLQDSTVATALVAVIDPEALTLCYACAGHPAPVVGGPTLRARVLPHGSLPLGIANDPGYQSYMVALERDGFVVLYTDGITEFARDIEAAERALCNAVDSLAQTPMQQPAEAIRRSVLGAAPPTDDAVLLVIRVDPTGERGSIEERVLRRSWSFHSNHAYSAHNARHEVMRFIEDLAPAEEPLFNTELILGEILANTVEHAPGLVTMDVDWTGDAPVVTVVDGGPGLERFAAQLPSDAFIEDGRGLYLVKTLARDVCVETDPGHGTKMTVTLPITRP